MRASPQRRTLPALVRTLRENGRLLAALARRCETDRLAPPAASPTFREPADIAAYLGPEMVNLPQEQLRVVLLDARPARVRRPRRWGDGVFGWGYDCGRCGARVRGLDDGRVSCQRCLAPVACRAINAARELEASEATKPAAA